MKLTHPATDQVIEVADGDEHRYLSQGWHRTAGERVEPATQIPDPRPAKKRAPARKPHTK